MNNYIKIWKSPHEHIFWIEEESNKLIISGIYDDYGGRVKNPENSEDGLLYIDFKKIKNKNWELEIFVLDKGSDYRLPVLNEDNEETDIIISDKEYDWLKDREFE